MLSQERILSLCYALSLMREASPIHVVPPALLNRVCCCFPVSKAEDPEKILEQAVNDMQGDLIKMRQASAQVPPPPPPPPPELVHSSISLCAFMVVHAALRLCMASRICAQYDPNYNTHCQLADRGVEACEMRVV